MGAGGRAKGCIKHLELGWWAELGVAVRVRGRVRDSNLRLVTRARAWGGV